MHAKRVLVNQALRRPHAPTFLQVIALDENDQIVGHVNKYLSHRFVPGTPRGILHRAFSVFLFDQDGKLLLQKVCVVWLTRALVRNKFLEM